MNITQERTDPLNTEIKIHLTPEDYRDKVNSELKRQAKRASMPGFRPGKVPVGVIRKMAGMAVLMEQLNQTINEQLNTYIQDEDLRILGEPLPKGQKKEEDFDVNCNIDLEFIFEVGLAPEFDLNLKLDKLPSRYNVNVDDAFLDEKIKENQERFGEVAQAEKVEKGDIIYGRLIEADAPETEEEEEDASGKMIVLNPSRVENEKVFKPFYGLEIEGSAPFELSAVSDDPEKIASLLFLEAEDIEAFKDKSLKLIVKRINRITEAELNPDFYHKVLNPQMAYQQVETSEEDKVETEEEFRAEFRKRIEDEFEQSAAMLYQKHLREALLESHSLDLPDEFLKRWLRQSIESQENKEELTNEQLEEQYERFGEQIKWSLITEKIQNEHPEVKVEEEDLHAKVRDVIHKSIPNLDPQQEEEYFNYFMKEEQMVRQQYNDLFDTKLNALFDETFSTKAKKIKVQKFIDLVEAEK